jgi:hypothetical protein
MASLKTRLSPFVVVPYDVYVCDAGRDHLDPLLYYTIWALNLAFLLSNRPPRRLETELRMRAVTERLRRRASLAAPNYGFFSRSRTAGP